MKRLVKILGIIAVMVVLFSYGVTEFFKSPRWIMFYIQHIDVTDEHIYVEGEYESDAFARDLLEKLKPFGVNARMACIMLPDGTFHAVVVIFFENDVTFLVDPQTDAITVIFLENGITLLIEPQTDKGV